MGGSFGKEIMRRVLKEVSQSSGHQGYSSQQYHHIVAYSAHFFVTEIREVDLETVSSGTGSLWNRLQRKEVQHLRKVLKDSMRSKRISDRAHLSIWNQTSLHPQPVLECFDFQRFGRYSNWNIWNQGLDCVCFLARSRKLNG